MPSGGFPVPVILLVFRRPALTEQVLARIRAARPSHLRIVADGPRPDRAGEPGACAATRELLRTGVDWPCEVSRDYADTNLGCARRVASGLTAAFAEFESAVILEDDCVPDPSFFPFCAELLERYRDDERIAQIAGCSFLGDAPVGPESYFLSRYPHCWGWATWRRAWRHYDPTMRAWHDPASRRALLGAIEDPSERTYWSRAFARTAAGRMDSWAYRWTLSCWARGALSANAVPNLVANVGQGRDATHAARTAGVVPGPAVAMPFPLQHPAAIERNAAADAVVGRRWFRPRTLVQRAMGRLRAVFG